MKAKQLLFLFSFLFLVTIIAGQSSKDSLTRSKKDAVFVLSGDTVRIILKGEEELKHGFDIQRDMPWIGAIMIGILTVIANILINRQLRKSNSESINKQLESSKETTLAQIDNARVLSEREFNKTVLSGNRQNWINDLRDLISKIIAKATRYSLNSEQTRDALEDLIFLIAKAKLMLNATKDFDFIKSLDDLELCWITIMAKQKKFRDILPLIEKVRKHTEATLKTEWERVKRGE